ncbi:hypothetical protein KSZ_52130 [Dictyobacter formicarum]|uniref:Uncharacterized protein n=1 Tax=Dictyobacter formicarum TaxID=2778368 RepID=A0ABQ3VLW8_9CHLR|nr:hypothetical protein KSZ_52130 [Dictyobacter formicarum]
MQGDGSPTAGVWAPPQTPLRCRRQKGALESSAYNLLIYCRIGNTYEKKNIVTFSDIVHRDRDCWRHHGVETLSIATGAF